MNASERLAEMRIEIAEENKYAGIDFAAFGGYKLISALEEILAMEETPQKYASEFGQGYNQCLAEVKAIIEGKVK